MMTKLIAVALCLAFISQSKSQDLYVKTVTETRGGSALMKMAGKGLSETYSTKGVTKTKTTLMNWTTTEVIEKDRVTVISPDLCGIFSREELANDGLNDEITYKNVRVTKTGETKELLGYSCKKAVLNYVISRMGDFEYETVVWYTSEIEGPDNSDLPRLTKENPFLTESNNLGGMALLSETLMKATGITTIARVTEIKTKKIDQEEFLVSPNLCKKPKNLEEYKKELKKRERRAGTGF